MSKEHVDHCGDYRWCSSYLVILILGGPLELEWIEPFGNNEDIHPSEEDIEEDDLGDEFEDEVQWFVEVDGIESLHADTERHLEYSKDNCDLHLDAVGDVEVVVTLLPSGVEAGSVHAVLIQSVVADIRVWVSGVVGVDTLSVTGVEELDRHGEPLVVDESVVNSEESHHEDQVSGHQQGFHCCSLHLVITEYKNKSKDK